MVGEQTKPAGSIAAVVRLAVLAAVVGVVSAYASLGFLVGISWVQSLLVGSAAGGLSSMIADAPWWRVLLAPAIGGLAVGLMVRYVMPGRVAQGPADVIEAVRAREGRMPLRRGLVSAAASVVSIGAGASVGRYGPAVHLGATLGSWLSRYVAVDRSARVALLGAGAAAAIAAAFNAPLAGVLFAHEVVIGGFAVRAVMPVVVASAVGASVVRAHGSALALFELPDPSIEHLYEYPLFIAVGVLGGVLAIVFIRSVDLATRHVARVPGPDWARPMFGGFLIGLGALAFPEIFGLGEDVIQKQLHGQYALWLLLALIPVKILATSLSLGFGFYGGVLGPALFLGAALGQAFGLALDAAWPGALSHGSVYAVAGMGAVISRVAGAPIATILIVFELTGSYTLTTAAMIAVVVASAIRSRGIAGSHFAHQLAVRGIDPYQTRVVTLLKGEVVRDRIRPPAAVLERRERIDDALGALLEAQADELLVSDLNGLFLGVIGLRSLVAADRAGRSSQEIGTLEMRQGHLTAGTDLHAAMAQLRGFVGTDVPVVESDDNPVIIGIIHESDLMAAYHEAVARVRDEDSAG